MSLPPPIERLVVTGATGWLGRTALGLARRWWGGGADGRVLAYGSREGRVEVAGGGFAVRPLAELPGADLRGAVVLHFAFLTKDRLGEGADAEFVSRNIQIDDAVATAVRRSTPAGLFAASSGAARLVQQGGGDLYGLMKLMQERRFCALRAEIDAPVLTGRIWSVAGPHINKPEAYALAAFLLQARRQGRVTIEATLPVYRSYLHVEDLVSVLLATLTAPGRTPAGVIDLAGAQAVEMADVAREAALAAGLDETAVERGAIDFTRRNVYLGDPTPFRDLALAAGVRPHAFTEQVRDTLRHLDDVASAEA